MYRITYTKGNGYRCSCCRRESTYTEDCETLAEVIAFLNIFEADQQEPLYDDADDKSIDNIVEIKNESVNITADKESVEKIINERRQAKAKKLEEENERKKQAEIAHMKQLMKKYPNAHSTDDL